MSQLTSYKSERPKGTLPSQPITNPRNSSQAHVAQEDTMNQCNVVHILRSRKQIKCQCHQTQLKHPLLVSLNPLPNVS